MKSKWQIGRSWLLLGGVLWALILGSGCEAPVYAPTTGLGIEGGSDEIGKGAKLRIGEQLSVTFSGTVADPLIHDFTEAIKEDGTITPPQIGPVVAAGKTPGVLQSELQTNYNKLYNHLTVTVVEIGRAHV